jgi:tetratricopeptide (TPR) repeat protein
VTDPNKGLSWIGLAFWILALPLAGLFQVVPANGVGGIVAYSLVNMVLTPLILFAIIALDQLVTAIAARALGDKVAFVVLGVGPLLRNRPVRGVSLLVRPIPLFSVNGIVTTRAKGQRARLGVAMFAGASAVIALVVLAAVLEPRSLHDHRMGLAEHVAVGTVIVFGGGFIALMSLLGAVGALIGTKGLTNIDDAALAVRRGLAYVTEANVALTKGAFAEAEAIARRGLQDLPDDPALHAVVINALSCRGDERAFDAAAELLTRELPPWLRPQVQNLWAWECYVQGREDLHAAADTASSEALAATPDSPHVLDTRGHILLWNGDHVAAEKCLVRAYGLSKARSNRASSAAGIAMICAAGSRIDEAHTWLERGRREDPAHRIMARAVAAVAPLSR